MTTMAQALEAVRETAKSAKEARSRKRDSNIPALVMAYRGNQLIAMATPAIVDRDAMLAVCGGITMGLAPDVIAVAMETWHAKVMINPRTGAPWEPGELQEAVDYYDAIEQGWVSDALFLTVVNRAGDARGDMMPYRMVAKNVVWEDGPFNVEEAQLGGFVANELIQMMNAPTIGQLFARMGEAREPGVTDEMDTAMNDCIAVKAMLSGDLGPEFRNVEIALQAERGTEREAVIKEMLGVYGRPMR
jgi:hypothetical protein